jgi:hypothetical protein
MVFQMADVFAGHCSGNAEFVGGTGKAALSNHFAKNLQAE